MKEILQATKNERVQYFQEAVARSDKIKNPIIIEKDFWVCWTLNQIFTNSVLSSHITFKGGTSLSKCYDIIDRFSEDIDLTLSKNYIGITAENDPATATSTNQRSKRLEALTKKIKDKVNYEIKPLLISEFKKHLPPYFTEQEWRLETDNEDEQNLIYYYPASLEKKSDEYIETSIKLEFGARGDINPCESKIILPYMQILLPELFNSPPEIKVTSLIAKRTFWEKATLLHAEYHRDPKKPLPSRMFRHYYDVVMLDKSNMTQNALQDTALLKEVVRNKSIYFPSKWANYDEATIGSLHLSPNEIFIEQLRQDHKNMTDMFFGDMPDFDKTMSEIKRIEKVVNGTL